VKKKLFPQGTSGTGKLYWHASNTSNQ